MAAPPPAAAASRRSATTIGLITLVVAAILLFLGFTKDIPFTHGFILKAQFQSANSIRPNSPVRIAGRRGRQGQVDRAAAGHQRRGRDDGDQRRTALPIHTDATAKIRPRIFLEGNFFVDLQPGTPGAPTLHSGDTIKITQTATPVQLDQVLTSLQSDTREDLQAPARRARDRAQRQADGGPERRRRPDLARARPAPQSFNDAYDDIPAAERSTAQVLRGAARHRARPRRRAADPRHGAPPAARSIRNESQLQDLITNFNDTMAAFAVASPATCARAIRLLAPTLRNANAAFASLNARVPADARVRDARSCPACARRRRRSTPRSRGSPRRASSSRKQELGGLAEELSPATRDLAQLIDRATSCCRRPTSRRKCVRDVVLPDRRHRHPRRVHDRQPRTTRSSSTRSSGIAGEGQNFDGNGMYVRFQTGGGSQHGLARPGSSPTRGAAVRQRRRRRRSATGRPIPGKRPPYKPDVPCYKQKLPNLNGPAAAKSPPTGSSHGAGGARRPARRRSCAARPTWRRCGRSLRPVRLERAAVKAK